MRAILLRVHATFVRDQNSRKIIFKSVQISQSYSIIQTCTLMASSFAIALGPPLIDRMIEQFYSMSHVRLSYV